MVTYLKDFEDMGASFRRPPDDFRLHERSTEIKDYGIFRKYGDGFLLVVINDERGMLPSLVTIFMLVTDRQNSIRLQ